MSDIELERDDIWVLNEVRKGRRPSEKYHFNVALLIAEDCLNWDEGTNTLSLTEKGSAELEFYKEDYPWVGR